MTANPFNVHLTLDKIADALGIAPRVVKRAADARRFRTAGDGPDRSAWLADVRDALEHDKENCTDDTDTAAT